MKTTFTFIFFVTSSILAGIGTENGNSLAMVAGLIFMALTVILVLSDSEKEIQEHV